MPEITFHSRHWLKFVFPSRSVVCTPACSLLLCVCLIMQAFSSVPPFLNVCFVLEQVTMLALVPSHHLQARCLARLVSVSPGDFGGLSIMGREGISNDDCVLGRDHSTVPGHRDGCQHVVTWNENTADMSHLDFFLMQIFPSCLNMKTTNNAVKS